MIKRGLDFSLSFLALILLIPVLMTVSFCVVCSMGRPVLFSQLRAGKEGRSFKMYKFRSMGPSVDAQGGAIPDDERVTALGRRLRNSSLDELPGLWSVLKGDMSLVGPRPLLVDYLPLYSPEQARRHEVKPGITGWAQINGRNGISWEDKFKLDVWYVDNRSLLLDLKILFRTVKKVVAKEGVNSEQEGIMPRFTGTKGTGSE